MSLLDILFPKKCVGCGKEGQYICQKCEIFLSEVNMTEAGPRSDIISVWEYEGVMEKLIWRIKYDGQFHIIDELVEKALDKIELNLPEGTLLTFVPMYKKREKQRGFNQAELIARKIGEKINREVAPLLIKTKDNRSQVGLSPQERFENVSGVFAANMMEAEPLSSNEAQPNEDREEDEIPLRAVLIVDDVYTTGATMKECQKVLRKNGVKNIWGFTLARKLAI